jgi:hypothetical protein
MVIKKAKSIIKDDKIKQTFIFSFSLLQNSTSLNEFNKHLEKIFILFKSQTLNSLVTDALIDLNESVVHRNISKAWSFIGEENTSTVHETPEYDESYESECESSLKKSSPFTKYFLNVIENFKLSSKCELFGSIPNEYYFPELFEIIKNYLYVLPLWTGIGLTNNGSMNTTTRLTNNPVENWFHHLKYDLILEEKIFPNQFATILYEHIRAKYVKFFLELDLINLRTASSKEFMSMTENFKNETKFSNEKKGFYYSNKWELNGIDFLIEKGKSVVKDDFLLKIQEIKPTNGGSCIFDHIFCYMFINTCSINYFILVLYVISEKNALFKRRVELGNNLDDFEIFLRNLNTQISSNNWNLSRLNWLESNDRLIKKKSISAKSYLYDCLTSEYEAYSATYLKLQEFKWCKKCTNIGCIFSTDTQERAKSFNLKYYF